MTLPTCYRCGNQPCTCADGQTIYHADCREVLPLLEPGSVGMFLMDPQYGISTPDGDFTRINGKGTRKFDFFPGDNDASQVNDIVRDCLIECERVATTKSSAYVWCGHKQFGWIEDFYSDQGWTTRFVVWAKSCPAPSPPGSGWPAGAELCVYAFMPGRTWNPRPGDPPASNVLRYDSYRHGVAGKVKHPTQKPLGLFRELIAYSTKPDTFVLDPFAGSFTTLRACKDLGRRGIGIELEEKYCEIGARRLEQGVLF